MKIIDDDTLLFIYENVCKFANIPYSDDDIKDEDLSGDNYKILYIVNKLVQEICIKTNRNVFPKDLKYLAVDLTINCYVSLMNESNPATNQNVLSMSEAGRSVSFGATDMWKVKYQLMLAEQIKSNENLINRYKLLYKVECPYAEN